MASDDSDTTTAVVATAVLIVSVLLLSVGGAAAQEAAEGNQQCTACNDGSPQTAPPETIVDIPSFGRRTCAEIASFATLLPASSDRCDVLQSLGSLCGCPVAENACRLCGGEVDENAFRAVRRPNVTLDGVYFSDFVSSIAEPVSNEYINCGMLEAVLHSHEQESDLCLRSQYEYAELCGCYAPEGIKPGDTNSSSVPQDTSVTSSLPPEFSQCSPCPGDGVITTIPNRTLDLGRTIPASNCVQLAALANLVSADAAECSQIKYLGTYCGCPVPESSCSFCANGESVLYPDAELDWFSGEQGFAFLSADAFPESLRVVAENLTCELQQSILHGVDLRQASPFSVGYDAICLALQLKSPICGCEPPRRAVVILWSHRMLAILSLLGSSLILYDIFSQPKKRSSMYHQIVIGVCCFDLISSTAYALVGVLFPESSGFYGSRGNQSTCKLQGFMIQLGLTSMFYNVLLSFYYLFVIKYNWKEFRFQKFRIYVRATVIATGCVMASAAFPFYGEQSVVCYVVSAPRADSEVPISVFYTIPVSISLALITAANVAVCWTVYGQERKALKWRLRQDQKKNMEMTKKVVWQSLFYAASFYFTIPLSIITHYIEMRTARHYSIAMSASAVSASQGFLNALVYFYRSDSLSRPGRLLVSVLGSFYRCLRGRDSKGTNQEENQNNKTSTTTDETRSRVEPNNADQSGMRRGGEEEEAKQEEDSPSLGDEEHRLEVTADAAGTRDELTDQRVSSSGQDGTDVVLEDDIFEAAVEHWKLTEDDGQLRRPAFRSLQSVKSTPNVVKHTFFRKTTLGLVNRSSRPAANENGII